MDFSTLFLRSPRLTLWRRRVARPYCRCCVTLLLATDILFHSSIAARSANTVLTGLPYVVRPFVPSWIVSLVTLLFTRILFVSSNKSKNLFLVRRAAASWICTTVGTRTLAHPTLQPVAPFTGLSVVFLEPPIFTDWRFRIRKFQTSTLVVNKISVPYENVYIKFNNSLFSQLPFPYNNRNVSLPFGVMRVCTPVLFSFPQSLSSNRSLAYFALGFILLFASR